MKILDNRIFIPSDVKAPIPGTVIFSENKYLLITDVEDLCVDLSTGDLLEPPTEVFDSQILNNVKLVIE